MVGILPVSYTHLDVYKRQLVDRAPLTEKQQNVYESIMQYQRVNGYAPTIREICKMVGLATKYW